MSRKYKGGVRNNGQPRVTLVRGLTRVAQLKAAIRELYAANEPDRRLRIYQEALDGTFIPHHLKPEVKIP